jgi:hypothetical protein
VSSANRGVRGGLREDDDDEESLEAVRTGVRFRARVRFFPSSIGISTTTPLFYCNGVAKGGQKRPVFVADMERPRTVMLRYS